MNLVCLLNRTAWNKTIRDASVFRRFFKTASGEWTEDETKADYQRWHNLPTGAMCCDVRYENHYIVAGKRYDDIHEAKDAMYDESFIKPAVIPIINIALRKLRAQERRKRKSGQVCEVLPLPKEK